MNEVDSDDIEVFVEAVEAYFQVTTRERAIVRSAYLLEKRAPFPLSDFTGAIALSGACRGTVCFSAPRGMLSHLLLKSGEQDYSDTAHCDLVGEIANQFAGRARRHFGDKMIISPPTAFMGVGHLAPRLAETIPFVVPLTWQNYEGVLVVHIEL